MNKNTHTTDPIEYYMKRRGCLTQVIGDRTLMNMNLAEGWKTVWKLYIN